jgi:hypothetical protein
MFVACHYRQISGTQVKWRVKMAVPANVVPNLSGAPAPYIIADSLFKSFEDGRKFPASGFCAEAHALLDP